MFEDAATHPRTTLARMSLFGLALLGLVAAACGGDDSGQAKSEAGLKKAAREANEALIKGENKALYQTLSKECREDLSYSEFVGTMTFAKALIEGFSGAKLKDLEVAEVEILEFDKDEGVVRVKMVSKKDPDFTLGEDDEGELWSYEDGRWVTTDCEDFSMGSDSSDSDESEDTPTPKASETARRTSTPAATATPAVKPKVGTTVEVEGTKYTVNTVEDPMTPVNQFDKPKAGNRFVAVDVTVEAVKEKVSVNSFDFSVQDADSYLYETTFASKEPRLQSGELAVGQKVRGWLVFELPANAKLISILVEPGSFGPRAIIADLTQR